MSSVLCIVSAREVNWLVLNTGSKCAARYMLSIWITASEGFPSSSKSGSTTHKPVSLWVQLWRRPWHELSQGGVCQCHQLNLQIYNHITGVPVSKRVWLEYTHDAYQWYRWHHLVHKMSQLQNRILIIWLFHPSSGMQWSRVGMKVAWNQGIGGRTGSARS